MKLVINGQEKELECGNISELLSGLNLNKNTVAIELNKNSLSKDKILKILKSSGASETNEKNINK